jgi:transposase
LTGKNKGGILERKTVWKRDKETSMKQNSIVLTQEQRQELEALISAGQAPARKLTHARILLKADAGPAGPRWSERQSHEALDVGEATVRRVRHRFVQEGLQAALTRRRQPPRPAKRKLDGQQEAHLIALLCGPAPEGYARWSLRLVADKLVELELVETVSHETVRQVLKKTNSNRG